MRCGARGARGSHRFQRERDVAGGGAPGQQRLGVVLEHDRDVAARTVDRRAGKGDLAARRRDQACRDAQRRRLAAAGRADDADDLAAPHFERELSEHEMIAEGEVDVAKGDQWRRWDRTHHAGRSVDAG